jgi:hypothetical protein
MGLFTPEVFRSFLVGFGATAVIMGAFIAPQL